MKLQMHAASYLCRAYRYLMQCSRPGIASAPDPLSSNSSAVPPQTQCDTDKYVCSQLWDRTDPVAPLPLPRHSLTLSGISVCPLQPCWNPDTWFCRKSDNLYAQTRWWLELGCLLTAFHSYKRTSRLIYIPYLTVIIDEKGMCMYSMGVDGYTFFRPPYMELIPKFVVLVFSLFSRGLKRREESSTHKN